jgi:hypothetical protein
MGGFFVDHVCVVVKEQRRRTDHEVVTRPVLGFEDFAGGDDDDIGVDEVDDGSG